MLTHFQLETETKIQKCSLKEIYCSFLCYHCSQKVLNCDLLLLKAHAFKIKLPKHVRCNFHVFLNHFHKQDSAWYLASSIKSVFARRSFYSDHRLYSGQFMGQFPPTSNIILCCSRSARRTWVARVLLLVRSGCVSEVTSDTVLTLHNPFHHRMLAEVFSLPVQNLVCLLLPPEWYM